MSRRQFFNQPKIAQPKFELTALIDVIFILVLFFAVTTTFENQRQGLKLTLPNAIAIETPKKAITISIDRNQRVYWNGKRISEANVAAKVKAAMAASPSQQILLQADKRTPYARVIAVLDAIRRSGCSQVMLEAEKS